MIKVHLDTDIGGDIDDLCALAMLLRLKDVQLTGVTTVVDNQGQRAGYARAVLDRADHLEVPVAAGAEATGRDENGPYFREEYGLPAHEAYWDEPVRALPGPAEAALALIKDSLDQGARIVGIGPFTNLCLFGQKYPGALEKANVFLMGGYLYPVQPGFPQWGNDFDFNVQADVRSARYVMEHVGQLTLIPLTMTVETALRRAYLPSLRQAGWLGRLLARQAEAFALENHYESKYGAVYPGLPDDLINFQHDPLACAIALGWDSGVEFAEGPLITEEKGGWLAERFAEGGRPARVVRKIDAEAFNRYWLEVVAGS